MKTNLEKIANSIKAVKKLADVDLGSPTLNFKFMSVAVTADAETKKYIQLQKNIIEKYRDKTKKDDIVIPFDSVNDFNKDMREAGTIEVELGWEPIACKVDALAGFTANDMQTINGLYINIEGE